MLSKKLKQAEHLLITGFTCTTGIIPNDATKPEVVITMRRYEIEMLFWRLDIGFRGRQSRWNIERHEVPYRSA
jgi:hypothetical protein